MNKRNNLKTNGKMLTCRLLARGNILVPWFKPVKELLGITLVSLLTYDLLQADWLIFVYPKQCILRTCLPFTLKLRICLNMRNSTGATEWVNRLGGCRMCPELYNNTKILLKYTLTLSEVSLKQSPCNKIDCTPD